MNKAAKTTKLTSIVAKQEDSSYERIFEFFKERLLSGELQPQDRLLPERELAQRLQVSRGSLREAMRAMAMLGIIEIRPGQGTFVRSPDVMVLKDFFGIMLAMKPQMYSDVLEARIAIECQAIRIACANATESDLRRIELALEWVLRTIHDTKEGAEADYAFHTSIVDASHNEVLKFIYDSITTLLKRSHLERRKKVVDEREFLDTLGAAHKQIYEALITQDADHASDMLRAHFTLAQDYISTHKGIKRENQDAAGVQRILSRYKPTMKAEDDNPNSKVTVQYQRSSKKWKNPSKPSS